MGFEVLATTAGVAILMAVLPRALFALRFGRAEGLSMQTALVLLLLAGSLAVYGASLANLPAVAANLAAAGASLGYLLVQERCSAIAAERDAVHAQLRRVRPARRLKVRH